MAKPVRWQHRVELFAARLVIGAVSRLPLDLAARLGGVLGAFAHDVVRIRRPLVERQVRAAFPEYTEAQVREVVRDSYINLGRTAIEGAVMPRHGAQAMLDRVERVDGWEHIEAARAAGTGLLVVSGHLGNWELGGSYLTARGIPFDGIARHMSNPLFERWVTEAREGLGMRIVFDDESVRRTPRSIRENRVVGFLADHGAAGLASTWVPFFGRLAKTPRGPAVFAMRLGAPMVLVVFVREPSGRYRMVIEPLPRVDTGDREADVDAMVAHYTARLEAWVRQYPGQYFWQHNRWKHQPPAAA